jgi:hypothetical protein
VFGFVVKKKYKINLECEKNRQMFVMITIVFGCHTRGVNIIGAKHYFSRDGELGQKKK